MTSFELVVDVQPEDIDELNHVNNLVYLRWGAQVAHAHVAAIRRTLDHNGLGWVALRHEIDYKKSALLGDRVRLLTTMGPAQKLSFTRRTRMLRVGDEALLAVLVSTYCPIRLDSGKPTAVSVEFRSAYSSAG